MADLSVLMMCPLYHLLPRRKLAAEKVKRNNDIYGTIHQDQMIISEKCCLHLYLKDLADAFRVNYRCV